MILNFIVNFGLWMTLGVVIIMLVGFFTILFGKDKK